MGKIPEEKLEWLKSLLPYATAARKKWPGMRVSVCIAQAALETAWGKRPIGGWNLWGLKAMKWVPKSVEIVTHEWDAAIKEYVKITARFCAFDSPAEGFEAYGRLVTNSPSYRNARDSVDLEAYVREIGKVWATDPIYAQKINWIIKEADLGYG